MREKWFVRVNSSDVPFSFWKHFWWVDLGANHALGYHFVSRNLLGKGASGDASRPKLMHAPNTLAHYEVCQHAGTEVNCNATNTRCFGE